MSEREQAKEILKLCRCPNVVDELKMITIAFNYWEDGCDVQDAVSKAAEFILNNDKNLNNEQR